MKVVRKSYPSKFFYDIYETQNDPIRSIDIFSYFLPGRDGRPLSLVGFIYVSARVCRLAKANLNILSSVCRSFAY